MTLTRAVELLQDGDWNAAHEIVQDDESPQGCWAHGIVHLMEGDVSNARYWYRRAGRKLPGARWDTSPDREDAIAAEVAGLKATLSPLP